MPKKRHKPEEVFAKLRQVDVLTSQGAPLGEPAMRIRFIDKDDALFSALDLPDG